MLWRDTFFGRSTIKGSDDNTIVKDGFTVALDDIIVQLFSNEMFLEQLRKSLIEEPNEHVLNFE